jgi:hypothetical protein
MSESMRCSHAEEHRVDSSEWTDPFTGRLKATVTYRCSDCDRCRWEVETLETPLNSYGGES